MHSDIRHRIEQAIGTSPITVSRLSGGCVGDVWLVTTADSTRYVAKVGRPGDASLTIEVDMLRFLAQHTQLPVPSVLLGEADLLLMTHIQTSGSLDGPAQRHAANLLAALHDLSPDLLGLPPAHYGFPEQTLIGGLPQQNAWCEFWVEFFASRRLMAMAQLAGTAGRLPSAMIQRIEQLCARLNELLPEPERASLIHGDAWGGNILTTASTGQSRIAAFIDPAIYFAHAEVELAFTTLFGTFGDPFFEEYQRLRPLDAGFIESRRDLYNLYPLLVHVRLFGGAYLHSVDHTLSRFGF